MSGMTRRHYLGRAAAALAGILAAACGPLGGPGPSQPSKAAAPAKLRYTSQYRNPPESDNEAEVVGLFRQQYRNIEVEIELYAGENVREKLIALAAAGTPPDAANVETKWAPGFHLKGILLDLTPHARRMGVKADDYFPQEWQKAHIAGKLVVFPLDLQIVVMFYNKEVFQAKGVPFPPAKWADPAWTWDEALQRARRLTGGEGAQRTFGIDHSRWWVYTYPHIWSAGGTVVNKERTKATITAGPTIDAIQSRADLLLKHRVHPDPDELRAGGGSLGMFINNRLAMEAIWSPWAFRIAAQNPNVNYDLAPRPRGQAGAFTRAPSDAVIVLSGTKAPEAATLLAGFVAGEEGQRLLVAQRGMGIPPLKKVARSDDFLKPKVRGTEGRNFRVVLDVLEGSHYKYQDVTPVWDDMDKLINEAHGKVLLGQMSAGEMARSIAPQIDALLAGLTPEGRAFLGD